MIYLHYLKSGYSIIIAGKLDHLATLYVIMWLHFKYVFFVCFIYQGCVFSLWIFPQGNRLCIICVTCVYSHSLMVLPIFRQRSLLFFFFGLWNNVRMKSCSVILEPSLVFCPIKWLLQKTALLTNRWLKVFREGGCHVWTPRRVWRVEERDLSHLEEYSALPGGFSTADSSIQRTLHRLLCTDWHSSPSHWLLHWLHRSGLAPLHSPHTLQSPWQLFPLR